MPLRLAVKPDLHLVILFVELEFRPLPLVCLPVLISLVQSTNRLPFFRAVCCAVLGTQLSVKKRTRGLAVHIHQFELTGPVGLFQSTLSSPNVCSIYTRIIECT